MHAASKTAAFGELRARLNTGALELYEHPNLLAELRRLRTRYVGASASVVNPRVGGRGGPTAISHRRLRSPCTTRPASPRPRPTEQRSTSRCRF